MRRDITKPDRILADGFNTIPGVVSTKMNRRPFYSPKRKQLPLAALLFITILFVSGCYDVEFVIPTVEPVPTLQAAAELEASGFVATRSEIPPTATLTTIPPTNTIAPTVLPRTTATLTPSPTTIPSHTPTNTPTTIPTSSPTPSHALMIESLRQEEFPGSELVIESSLTPDQNYNRYIASYESDGLKIYALLTVPLGVKPESGWPVIIFNHGYIPPNEYWTTERYVAYIDGFARNGYIVFRSDYRGHGISEGEASNAYGSPAYTVDVLNGISAIKRYPEADPDRIGMWGHSMGGHITLRAMVVSDEIKAGVIWG